MGGGIHRNPHKEGNGDKKKSMGTCNYLTVHKFALIGVSDHFVNTTPNPSTVAMNIYFEIPMDWIPYTEKNHKSSGI